MDKQSYILSKIKNAILENAPSAKMILYGSRVRDTAHDESDWDILILLAQEIITYDVEEKLTDPLYELEIELGEVISPLIYSEKEWNNKYRVTPFYHNVMKEGRVL